MRHKQIARVRWFFCVWGLLTWGGCAQDRHVQPILQTPDNDAPASPAPQPSPADAAKAPPPIQPVPAVGQNGSVSEPPASPPSADSLTIPDPEIDALRAEQEKTNAARIAKLDQEFQAALDAGTAQVIQTNWPDGAPRERKSVRRSPDGTQIEYGHYARWYPNGQQEIEVRLVDGKKEGRQRFWHDNGRLWTEQFYLNGQRHGVSFAWDPKGRKTKMETHHHGKPHGLWRIWNSRGIVKWQQRFDDGVPVGHQQ